MSEARQILINFVAGLSLADHMGDAADDALQALKQIGITFEQEEDDDSEWWTALATFLARKHGATTLFGTKLWDDDDGEDTHHAGE